jgi:cell division protein FtsL
MEKAQLTRLFQIAAVIVIAALTVGLYRAKSDAARTEAHVLRLEREVSDREARLRELRAEIAELESPARIERLAEDRLGLVAGGESDALPEEAIGDSLPSPRARELRP